MSILDTDIFENPIEGMGERERDKHYLSQETDLRKQLASYRDALAVTASEIVALRADLAAAHAVAQRPERDALRAQAALPTTARRVVAGAVHAGRTRMGAGCGRGNHRRET